MQDRSSWMERSVLWYPPFAGRPLHRRKRGNVKDSLGCKDLSHDHRQSESQYLRVFGSYQPHGHLRRTLPKCLLAQSFSNAGVSMAWRKRWRVGSAHEFSCGLRPVVSATACSVCTLQFMPLQFNWQIGCTTSGWHQASAPLCLTRLRVRPQREDSLRVFWYAG